MFVRRRRPLARAAMLGGAGYVAGKRAQQGAQREAGQEERLAALEQQQAAQAPPAQAAPAPTPPAPAATAPAPAPAPGGGDVVARLKELADLRDAGALTDEEFAAAKAQLLGGS